MVLGQLIEIKSAIDEDMDLLASFDRIKFQEVVLAMVNLGMSQLRVKGS